MTEHEYPVHLRITPPSGVTFVYSGYGTGDCSQEMDTGLFGGKDAVITCEMEVTSPPQYREERPLYVVASYRYEIEAQTQLRIESK